ncbi:MAG: hypothetical protein IJF59_04195, partial [Clostridia bacterium]|nr:hypothetical protein [Clostridia bacterium]
LSACKSPEPAYSHLGLAFDFPEGYLEQVTVTPPEELPEDVAFEAFHTASVEAGSGGLLCRVTVIPWEVWEKEALALTTEGRAPFAAMESATVYEKIDAVYLQDLPLDPPCPPEQQLDYLTLAEQTRLMLAAATDPMTAAPRFKSFTPQRAVDAALGGFLGSGMDRMSWTDPESLPAHLPAGLFVTLHEWKGGSWEEFPAVGDLIYVPQEQYEELLRQHIDVSTEYLRSSPYYDADRGAYRFRHPERVTEPIGDSDENTPAAHLHRRPQRVAAIDTWGLYNHQTDLADGRDRYFITDDDGTREVVVTTTSEFLDVSGHSTRFISVELRDGTYETELNRYFAADPRLLAALFPYPSGDAVTDDENLLRFAVTNSPTTVEGVDIRTEQVDTVLHRHFGRTLTSPETGISHLQKNGNIGWEPFAPDLTGQLVFHDVRTLPDGRLAAPFLHFDWEDEQALAPYGGAAVVHDRLLRGESSPLRDLLSQKGEMTLTRVPDPEDPRLFHYRIEAVTLTPLAQEAQGDGLIFYNGSLLGAFDGGVWQSLSPLPDASLHPFPANRLLEPAAYRVYRGGRLFGTADRLIWSSAPYGLSSFETPLAETLLTAHGRPVTGDGAPDPEGSWQLVSLSLPATLGPQGEALMIPPYAFFTNFGLAGGGHLPWQGEEDYLILSSDHNPFAAPPARLLPEQLTDQQRIGLTLCLTELFEEAGMGETVPRLTELLQADFDGDGESELIAVAQHPVDENFWPVAEGVGSHGGVGTFCVLLAADNAGQVEQVLYADLMPVAGELTFTGGLAPICDMEHCRSIRLPVAADLNADGTLELLLSCGFWESGFFRVYTLEDGRWQAVLQSDNGT